MFYSFQFDGKACKNVYYRKYKSDLHAMNAAYRMLQEQPYPPENGHDASSCAVITSYDYSLIDGRFIAIIQEDGEFTTEKPDDWIEILASETAASARRWGRIIHHGGHLQAHVQPER